MVVIKFPLLVQKRLHFLFQFIFTALATIKKLSKYSILIVLILLNSITVVKGQLTSEAKISILTCAPGDELYSLFGHTAIRVSDSTKQVDIVFNYGTFDFNTPNFYLKFLRGQLNYMLSVTTFDRFILEYQYDQRSVWEQELDLSANEKNNLFRALIINAEPENRFYHYHFFFDNCATRVRDMIVNNLDGDIEFPSYPENKETNVSYRDAIASYLQQKRWTKLGLDIILGYPTDDAVNGETIQFLPDYLMSQFKQVRRKDSHNLLVGKTNTLLQFNNSGHKQSNLHWILLWISALIILIVSGISIRYKLNSRWIDYALFTLTSAIGLLIVFLWFFTQHTVTGPNWNILWANPLHLIFLFRFKKQLKPLYFGLLSGVIITTLFFLLVPQSLPTELIPIWLVLSLRIFLYIRKR